MTSIETYRERRFDGRRTLTLEAAHVAVTGSRVFGTQFSDSIRLADLDPRPATLQVRHPGCTWFAALSAGSAIAWHFGWVGWGPGLTGVLTMAAAALATCRQIEWARFKNRQSGVVVLDVARAGPDEGDFDAFVLEISRRAELQDPRPEATDAGAIPTRP